MYVLDIQTHYINRNVVEIYSRAMKCELYVRPEEIGKTIGALTAEYLEMQDVVSHRNSLSMRHMPEPQERRVTPDEAQRIQLWANRNGRPFYRRQAQLGRKEYMVEMASKDWTLYDVS